MAITQRELARRLRRARKASQMTQARAAQALGVPRSAISEIESGEAQHLGIGAPRPSAPVWP